MPVPVNQATFDSVAKELLAAAGDKLIADRKSYMDIEAAFQESTSTDIYVNLKGVNDSLQALVDDLRS